MNGYLDDLENTAEVIRDGFYRTGDIASMSPDGYITITGRLSRFSKIGGEMVPHELVERTIAEYLESEGRSVAVTGKPDPKRGEKLIVFHTVENLDAEKLIEGLREKELPNLWIPKAENFVKLDSLPLLGSGKLDLQHLKKLVENTSLKQVMLLSKHLMIKNQMTFLQFLCIAMVHSHGVLTHTMQFIMQLFWKNLLLWRGTIL